jgi:predicted metal-dependent peptidase
MGQQLTPEQRLSKCVVDILGKDKYIALNGIVMIGTRMVSADKSGPYQTACTNGRDEWYHPDMINELSDAQVRYTVLHECKHKMYRHLITWKSLWDICPRTTNLACDYVINLELNDENKDGFAVMPEGNYAGVVDERFRGMNAKQVFDILYEEQGGKGGSGKGGSGKGGSGKGNGFDEHDWEGAEELTDAEKHQLERDVDQAIRQGALVAGKVGTGGAIDIEELLKPQVDWRQVMREFVQQTCAGRDYSSYRRPNRRYMSADVYMPTGISEQVGELVFAMDMSGSTGVGRMRPAMLAEIQSVCDMMNPERVRLLYWDTEITKEETYEAHELDTLHKSTKPAGGGGTTIECVSEHLANNKINAQAVIILTDGELFGGWGNFSMPVLWLIVDHERCRPPFGKVVHVDSTRE